MVKKTATSEDMNSNKRKPSKIVTTDIPRGKPKSGRIWKTTKTRFSSIIKTKGIRNSFQQKQLLREDLKRTKEASRSIKAQKEEEKEQKKQRRRENLKKREENSRKAEIVQVIKNPNKIKRMKKKQLRSIQKRDISELNK
ncbi:hypothetical protein PPYR_00695 [Photinus pyralis]|uniref:Coiled-coil domain-containing protein 86 n=1 Tax=Photinus pyralis TaxID=7054 RepID=A0A5N4B2A9_PHOPY|nr:coiled-coil domain-containing protein 86 [Photinus pyralis]KAB0803725.1 hypothetical protein PPYR_00695 [Photinus pyralis]